jgi:nucleoside diphosphate kinase
MQETAYIIKQDGMPLRHTIHWMILSHGFQIVANKYVTLPMRAFEALYPKTSYSHVPEEAWRFNVIFNTTGICEVGILCRKNALEHFLRLAGHRSDPALCAEGTIRREFGMSNVNTIAGYPIHLKAVHRSEKYAEGVKDLAIVRSLIGA